MTRRGAISAGLAVLSACSAPVVEDGALCGFGNATAPVEVLGRTGASVTVPVTAPVTCRGKLGPVQVSVSNEQEPVDATWGDGYVSNDQLTVDVTLTPRRSGIYHFIARFQPNLAVAQADLHVVDDAPRESVTATVPALASCNHLELFPSGQVVCMANAISAFDLSGASVVEQPFEFAVAAARAGDFLWVLTTDGMVTRWRDGHPFTKSPGAPADTGRPTGIIMPSESDAIVINQSPQNATRAVHVRMLQDAGMAVAEQPDSLSLVVLGAWRNGDHYGTLDNTSECSSTLGSPATCAPSPVPNGTYLLGQNEDGVWTSAPPFGVPGARLAVHQTTDVASITVPVMWRYEGTSYTWGSSVFLDAPAGQFPLRLEGGQLYLERYGDEDAGNIVSVTRETVARRRGDELTLYRRR